MKKITLASILFFAITNLTFANVISGQINHNDTNFQNKIIDSKTNKPLANAKITIPQMNFTTYSDSNGSFRLNANINNQMVMLIEKEGYKTFSLTVDNNVFNSPLKLGIEQISPFDIQISEGVIHLGDNMFSNNSANSGDFRLSANGHYYSKTFKRPVINQKQEIVIRIGTIIGLDTKKAKQVGQNRIAKVYSNPTEIFVNGHKIAKLELNGDNFEILIPKNILKDTNELLIKAGRNLFQTKYTDYDDIELANLRIEIKDRYRYARNNYIR